MTREQDMPVSLGGSIIIHCLLAVGVIAYLAWIYEDQDLPKPRLEIAPPEPKELTVVLPNMLIVEEMVPEEMTPEEKARRAIDATGNKAAAEAPENAMFEADRNTVAASELPASADGVEGMPTLDGNDFAAMGLEKRNFSDGQNAAPAVIPVIFEQVPVSGGSPAETIEEPDKPEEEPPTAPEAEEEMDPVEDAPPGSELANVESFLEELGKDENSDMLADVPGKPVEEEEGFRKLTDLMPDEELVEREEQEKKEEEEMPEEVEPKPEVVPQPESNPDAPFQMSNLEGRQKGTIKNRGQAAVNAAETAYGKYMRVVKEVVGRDWQRAITLQSDFSTVGFMKVEFYIRPDGTTEGVRTMELNNNRVLQSITLDVILKAKFPPPPEEVLSLRADRRVHVPFGFHVN